jgi:hypothetical protein
MFCKPAREDRSRHVIMARLTYQDRDPAQAQRVAEKLTAAIADGKVREAYRPTLSMRRPSDIPDKARLSDDCRLR